jgi:hypothetical protein
MKRLVLFAAMACLLILNSARSLAQFETASVLGYVRDSSGATVAGATVSLVNQETRAEVTVKTNDQGAYEFTDVRVGSYRVTSQASGFDTTTTQSFLVEVNARQRVDVSLKVGSASEVVTVTGAAQLLETDSSERGQVIRHTRGRKPSPQWTRLRRPCGPGSRRPPQRSGEHDR